MPRYIMKLDFGLRVLDENGQQIDGGSIEGEVAIASKSKGVGEIIDSTVKEYSDDITRHAKEIFAKANEKK